MSIWKRMVVLVLTGDIAQAERGGVLRDVRLRDRSRDAGD
jgi:hypothetical protein